MDPEIMLDLGCVGDPVLTTERQAATWDSGSRVQMGPPPEPNRAVHPYTGTINYDGLVIYVENPPGSIRRGSGPGGPWSTVMPYYYGEIAGTRGADNDPVDVCVGPYGYAPMAYILHQRLISAPDAPMAYDEDKVMLGFASREQAIRAYASCWSGPMLEPGVTEIPVSELKRRFADGELEFGPIVKAFQNPAVSRKIKKLIGEGYPQKQAVAIALDMERRGELGKARHRDRLPGGKADRRQPGEFDAEQLAMGVRHEMEHTSDRAIAREIAMDHLAEDPEYYTKLGQIEKGRRAEPIGHVSWRKDGHYQKKAPNKWRRLGDVHEVKWEPDPTRSVSHLKPGDVIEVVGRDGLFMLDPNKPKPAKGATALDVVALATGAAERVRPTTVQVMRVRTAAPPKAKLPPPPPPPAPERVIGSQQPPHEPDQGTAVVQPGEVAKRAGRVKDSRAKPGTIHHKLENGEYILQRVKDRTGVRFRWAIHVPDADKVGLVTEFTPLMHRVSREIARKRPMVVPSKFGSATPEYEEILSGAKLGMIMALRNYDGSKPWLPWAEGYMRAYAAQAKRSVAGARPWTERDRRLVHTYLAASYQAASKKSTGAPSDAEIAASWYIQKRQAYAGTSAQLGSYMDATGKAVNQAYEPVPMEDWQIRTPTGEARGKMFPGKLSLIKKMRALTAGDRMASIIDENLGIGDGPQFPSDMPAGLVEHVKGEIELAVEKLGEPHRTVIRMLSGTHEEDGDPATKEQIAAAVGLGEGQSAMTQRRKLRESKLVEESLAMLHQIAASRGYSAEKYLNRVFPTRTAEARASDNRPEHKPFAPSQNELERRWGTGGGALSPVRAYHLAIKNGEGSEVARVLDKVKAGKASAKERHELLRKVSAWDVADRAAVARRYTAMPVDPELAKPSGPQGDQEPLPTNDDHIRAALRERKEEARQAQLRRRPKPAEPTSEPAAPVAPVKRARKPRTPDATAAPPAAKPRGKRKARATPAKRSRAAVPAPPPEAKRTTGKRKRTRKIKRTAKRKVRKAAEFDELFKGGEGSQRPGHKYISRKRVGDRWVYTYVKPTKGVAAAEPEAPPLSAPVGPALDHTKLGRLEISTSAEHEEAVQPNSDQWNSMTAKVFGGRVVPIHELLSWSGMDAADLKDAEVEIHFDTFAIDIQISATRFFAARRYLVEDGQRVANHSELNVYPEYRGLGAPLMARSLDALRRSGFARVRTFAAGEPSSTMNGYYTWPRMGFDGPIPPYFRDQLPAALSSARKMSDLMATAEGRDWWRGNGGDVDVEFDLHPSSLSSRIMAAYTAAKRESIKKGRVGSQRANHKYISRKRVGDRWVYTYAKPVSDPATRPPRKKRSKRKKRVAPKAKPAPRTLEYKSVVAFGGSTPIKPGSAAWGRSIVRTMGAPHTLDEVVGWSGLDEAAAPSAEVEVHFTAIGVDLIVRTPDYIVHRSYRKKPDGTKIAKHDWFGSTGEKKGVGTAVLLRATQRLRAAGFSQITTDASGHGGSRQMNGYYTWPRLGFDAQVPSSHKVRLPPSLANADRLSDLMATQEGRDWWRANGRDVWVTFDLNPSSLSSRVLAAYAAAKGIR